MLSKVSTVKSKDLYQLRPDQLMKQNQPKNKNSEY